MKKLKVILNTNLNDLFLDSLNIILVIFMITFLLNLFLKINL